MNELLYIIVALLDLSLVLLAFYLGRTWLFTHIIVNLLLVTLLAGKVTYFYGLPVTVGSPMYATIFLSTDVLAEHYGKKAAHSAVRLGLYAVIIFVTLSQLSLRLPPVEFHEDLHQAMAQVFATSLRVFGASTVAYLVSQSWDVFFFDTLKRRFRGRYLWLRNNLSTITSQLLDSILFFGLAFAGVMPGWWKVAAVGYATKVLVAGVDTPFIYCTKLITPLEKRTG